MLGGHSLSILELECPECHYEFKGKVSLEAQYDWIERITDMAQMWGIDVAGYKAERDRLAKLGDDMAEFLHEPLNDVFKRMLGIESRLAEQWSNHTGSISDFYIGNKDYLYDNIKYNLFNDYHIERLLPLMIIKDLKTLDIGCGIGTLVFMLAGQNNEATGFDINPQVIDFCNFKKAKYNLDAEFTTELPDLGNFDLITALGTLEHIDNLREFILWLGKGMKDGAGLFHIDDWEGQDVSPMHFDYSKDIDGWLQESGLEPLSKRWAVKNANIQV